MRELTGYEDRHGRPILEGDLVASHAGEIHLVEEISEGWYPLCFFEEHEIATIEVVGSVYTESGRRLLAANGIHWVDEEAQDDEGYENTLDPRRRQAITELSSLIRQHYPTATFDIAPDLDDPDITILWATVDVDDPDEVTDLIIERTLQLQVEEGVPVYVVPIRAPCSSRQTLSQDVQPAEGTTGGATTA